VTPETRLVLGLVALFAAIVDLTVGCWLMLQPPAVPEMVRCERCGKPVQLESMAYHRRRCAGILRSQPVASAQRRRW
jgi:hypothetical protein